MKKISVVKIGGNIIDNEIDLENFMTSFSKINGLKILVHGGGKIATQLSAQLGISSKLIDGRRITDSETLKIITMTYAGLINKKMVAGLQGKNCNALGLTGADANCIVAKKREVTKQIDYGFVGDIDSEKVNNTQLILFLENELTPVIAPITHDGKGQLLNTNADSVAAAIAIRLSENYETNLYFCFEKKGVLKNVNVEQSVIPQLTLNAYEKMKQEKKISDGMIPKLDNAFEAITKGVKSVFICHANDVEKSINENSLGGTKLFFQ